VALRAVIFDCFGVLTTDGWRQIQDRELQDDQQRLTAHQLERAVNTGEIGYDEFVTEVAALRGATIEATRAELVDTAANKQLFEFIRDTIKPRYQVGLLSNAADNWLDNLFEPWQVALFDEIVLSYAVGMVKPDPAIYDLIATKLGVKPDECLFVDDIERFVTAARDAGMDGILFESTAQFTAEYERKTA
jgi:putative hydrolase of the HAD superfamily